MMYREVHGTDRIQLFEPFGDLVRKGYTKGVRRIRVKSTFTSICGEKWNTSHVIYTGMKTRKAT